MSSNGRKLISTSAIAASDPSSPARGTLFLIQPENGAHASLKIPDARSIVMPKNQA